MNNLFTPQQTSLSEMAFVTTAAKKQINGQSFEVDMDQIFSDVASEIAAAFELIASIQQ